MAITINIFYTGKGDAAINFAKKMVSSGTVEKIKKEPGNLRYDYFVQMDFDNNKTVLLIDSWASQEALNIHHASPMMDVIIKLREKYDLHMSVERYISDNDIPEQDLGFIRK